MTELDFSENFQENEILLELPFEFEDLVLKKGINNQSLVCRQNGETYLLKEVQNSNTLLLLENDNNISGKVGKIIKAFPMKPNRSHIANLFRSCVYKSTQEFDIVSKSHLMDNCGCSDQECIAYLPDLYVVPYNEGYTRLDLTTIFEALIAMSVNDNIEDPVIKEFVCSYFFENLNPNWHRITRAITYTYFEKNKLGTERNWQTFQTDLREFINEIQIDEKMLYGIAVLDDKSSSVIYIPENNLPLHPEDRFKTLFKLKSKYKPEQIVPYINPLANNEKEIQNFIKLYCRSVVENGIEYYYMR
eukprot:NODE_26_length_40862_cov_0.679513.p16 type:complete len:303 gc:universal NODE_26_length_40862_cov_0.679513:40450-39542(-)